MKDVVFGQYYPSSSFVHKLDARIKILLTVAYIVAVFLVKEFYFLGFALLFGYVLFVTVLSKVPFIKVLGSIKTILFFIILSAVLQIFFNKNGVELLAIGKLKITSGGLINAGFIICRISLIVIGSSLLTFTTSPVEIADGIESLMFPLKLIRFHVHEFALIMSIALRFIPTLLDETDRIIKAQKARGGNFNKGGIVKKAKALIPILIPLLISSFRRADELADAMDSRCYSGSKTRTRYKKMKLTYKDFIALLGMGAIITGVILLNNVLGVVV